MGITATASNHFKWYLLDNIKSNTFKVILMSSGFTFDEDAHATLADVTSSQLSTGYGYTQDNKALSNVVVTESDVQDKGVLSCDDVTFTASGGDIGPFIAAIIYDETSSDDTILTCLTYDTAQTISDGTSFQITDIEIEIA